MYTYSNLELISVARQMRFVSNPSRLSSSQ